MILLPLGHYNQNDLRLTKMIWINQEHSVSLTAACTLHFEMRLYLHVKLEVFVSAHTGWSKHTLELRIQQLLSGVDLILGLRVWVSAWYRPYMLSVTVFHFLFSYLSSFHIPTDFSSCSRVSYDKFFQDKLSKCLFNTPLPTDIISSPICGNQLVETGEDCDCGSPEVLHVLSKMT